MDDTKEVTLEEFFNYVNKKCTEAGVELERQFIASGDPAKSLFWVDGCVVGIIAHPHMDEPESYFINAGV